MQEYLNLLYHVYKRGEQRMDRTGTGTLSVFDTRLKFDLREGFPALSTKRVFMKGVWAELLWMISGVANIQDLRDQNVKIWDAWAEENGDVGPIYGVQWRSWPKSEWDGAREYITDHIDQLQNVINEIRVNPTSRRLLVSAWNVGELHNMVLPPCHYAFQFYVRGNKYLDCKVIMRSVDVFLGMPFDIASYATLTHMVAYLTGLIPCMLTMDFGDTHIYLNHIEQVKEQLERKPERKLPVLDVNHFRRDIKSIDDFKITDLRLIGYDPQPTIKGDISV